MGDEEEEYNVVDEDNVVDEEAGGEEGGEGDDGDDGEGNPCVTCCFGWILLVSSLVFLARNEQNYVCTAKTLLFLSSNVEEKPCDSIVPANVAFFSSCALDESTFGNWSLADFVTGTPTSTEWEDLSPAARIRVERYACEEEKTTRRVNGRNVDTWNYQRKWVSNGFFRKPTQCTKARKKCGSKACTESAGFQFETGTQHAANLKAGVYTLPDGLKTSIQATVQFGNDVYPVSACESSPTPGCARIKTYTSDTRDVSIFSFSKDGKGALEGMPVPGSWGCPEEPYQRLVAGQFTMAAAIAQLEAENDLLVWLFRILAMVGSIIAVYAILSPIAYAIDKLGDVLNMIPCMGGALEDLVEGVAGVILWSISCGVGCCCSLFTIALFWLIMRPIWGGAMLAVCVICICLAYRARASGGAPNSKKNGARAREVEFSNDPAQVPGGLPTMQQQPMMNQQQPMMQQPMMQQPMMQQQQYNIQVPLGQEAGSSVPFQTPDGRMLTATVPPGLTGGQYFQVMA